MDNKDKLTGLYLFDDFIEVASERIGEASEDTLFVLISADFFVP